MSLRRSIAVLASVAALAGGVVAGCGDDDNEGLGEEAGKAIDTAADEAGQAIEKGAKEADKEVDVDVDADQGKKKGKGD
jgi:hypothetical protein